MGLTWEELGTYLGGAWKALSTTRFFFARVRVRLSI